MKNGIILLLSALVVFLLLFSIGAFRHGDIMARDDYSKQRKKRISEVSRSAEWNIGIAASVANPVNKQVIHGIRIAAEIVNGEGGVLGKPIKLRLEDSRGSFPESKFLVQDFCEDFRTAMKNSSETIKKYNSLLDQYGSKQKAAAAAEEAMAKAKEMLK